MGKHHKAFGWSETKKDGCKPSTPVPCSVRKMASALNEMCMGSFGIGLSNALDEARIILFVATKGKTYKQAERKLFPE